MSGRYSGFTDADAVVWHVDPMKPSVLIVEDEAPIRMGLCDVLAYHGLHPVEAADGPTGRRLGLEGDHALVLLDVMLPGVDGITVCRELRAARPALPILMLTARGDEASILEGFAAGADDYVTKPFSVAQLVARVQALLRRAGRPAPRGFVVGSLAVDPDALQGRAGGQTVELSARDIELLAYLAAHADRAVPREELLAEVWGFARVDRVETRCIDMHVVKLRRKLEAVGCDGVVRTVRGVGYRADVG